MKKSSPAWTLRGRSKNESVSSVPGPGAYNPTGSNLESSPKYRIGKSSRDLRLNSANPGPGAYDPQPKGKLSPRAVIGRSKRGSLSGFEETPGPGSYDGNSSRTGPRYTMQGLKPANKSDNLPGPGQYSPTSYTQTVNPAYCIGKATRMSRRNSDNPGPGSYNVSPDHSGPKWKVGTERRLSSTFSEFPGPGAYDTISENTMPAFSMTARRPLTSDCSVPGPGAYSPKSLNTNIQYSVGTASRDSAKKFDVPGPASYFIGTPKSRAAVFGSGQRNFVINSEKNPGPGTYEAKNAWDGPKYTVRSRNLIKSTQETPGPGNYNPAYVLKSEPAWKISKQKRDGQKANNVPGPGTYEKGSELGGPKWVFGRSQREDNAKETFPGPGAYDIKPSIPDIPAYASIG